MITIITANEKSAFAGCKGRIFPNAEMCFRLLKNVLKLTNHDKDSRQLQSMCYLISYRFQPYWYQVIQQRQEELCQSLPL